MAALEVKTRVSNAVLYTNGLIRIDNVRVSFPHLDKPYAGKEADSNAKPKYGIVGMLPKGTHEAAKDLIVQRIRELMSENDTKVPKDKWFIRDGDEAEREEYVNHWIVSARESRRPAVRNRQNELILDADEIADLVYGGCYCDLLIRPWYQDGQKVGKGYGKRINAGLVAVRFVRDGESFGDGRIDDSDAWEDGERREEKESDDDL